jgi:hypothetical protein
MTQFMLIIGNPPRDIDIIYFPINQADEFLGKIAIKLFTSQQLQMCWYAEGSNGESIHDLFSQAQTQILEGYEIRNTKIGKILVKVFQQCQEVVIWYSDDCSQLPEFTDINMAIDEICTELTESCGAIYLRFVNLIESSS